MYVAAIRLQFNTFHALSSGAVGGLPIDAAAAISHDAFNRKIGW